MFVLHVHLDIRPGHEGALRALHAGIFRSAIAQQEGYHETSLLFPEEGGKPILSISFASRPLQQKWVATDLHGEVWPQMEAHLEGYTLVTYSGQ